MTNKEAIEILENYHNGYFGFKIDDVHEAHNLAIKALEERPQGEWIYKKFDVESGIPHSYWCSKCGEPRYQWSDNFCACCGAKMKGGAV